MSLLHYIPTGETSPIEIPLNQQETVLEGLLRAGFDIPNGCRAGACQSCLMKTESDNIPPQARTGLKPTQIASGFFLSCRCIPDEPIRISHTDQLPARVTARIATKEWLNDHVLGLHMEPTTPFDYHPGQYVTLWKENTARCYSLASTPNDDYLELHVKHIQGGALSGWLAESVEVGDEITLQGPIGECYYTQTDQPILLCGIGTGLAPLLGILRDALDSGHTRKIHLLLGARSSASFYMVDQLITLARIYPNFSVTFISLDGNEYSDVENENFFVTDDIYQWVKKEYSSLKGFVVYLCGAESFVKKMKKICFLSGTAMSDIHADIFAAYND